jgi:ribosomal protein S12 methylthiotransferase accessory factor
VPLTAGYACRPDPEEALLAAFFEAAQSRLTDIHGAREDVEPMNRAGLRRLRAAAARLRPRRRMAALPRAPRDADARWLVRRLRRSGHRAAVFDLAPPGLGLAMVKVVVPTFRLSELL